MPHPLTTFRKSKGLTLEDFAAKIGASKGLVWKWENGAVPRRRHAQKIFKVTGGEVSPNDFVLHRPSSTEAA